MPAYTCMGAHTALAPHLNHTPARGLRLAHPPHLSPARLPRARPRRSGSPVSAPRRTRLPVAVSHQHGRRVSPTRPTAVSELAAPDERGPSGHGPVTARDLRVTTLPPPAPPSVPLSLSARPCPAPRMDPAVAQPRHARHAPDAHPPPAAAAAPARACFDRPAPPGPRPVSTRSRPASAGAARAAASVVPAPAGLEPI